MKFSIKKASIVGDTYVRPFCWTTKQALQNVTVFCYLDYNNPYFISQKCNLEDAIIYLRYKNKGTLQLIMWTNQPYCVYQQLKRDGIFNCDPHKSILLEEVNFQNAVDDRPNEK